MVVAMLAVARLSMLLVDDKLTVAYRQWVVRRWGEESMPSYLVHCNWCTSIWIAALVMPPAVLFPNRWVLAALSVPAASLMAGVIAKVRE
jgi:hypothetical protein